MPLNGKENPIVYERAMPTSQKQYLSDIDSQSIYIKMH
jgi:hypothetical protein